MTHKKKSRKKTWTAVLHDHGGYALFDHNGHEVGRYLDQKAGIRHHIVAVQALRMLGQASVKRYPIVFESAEELSLAATTPFVKPKIQKRQEARKQAHG